MRAELPSLDAHSLVGELVLHGHAQCYDLELGPESGSEWVIGQASYVDSEGNELVHFGAAVEYNKRTGHDVYVWWQTLVYEFDSPPELGWMPRRKSVSTSRKRARRT